MYYLLKQNFYIFTSFFLLLFILSILILTFVIFNLLTNFFPFCVGSFSQEQITKETKKCVTKNQLKF